MVRSVRDEAFRAECAYCGWEGGATSILDGAERESLDHVLNCTAAPLGGEPSVDEKRSPLS